jgi:hypothetical protein
VDNSEEYQRSDRYYRAIKMNQNGKVEEWTGAYEDWHLMVRIVASTFWTTGATTYFIDSYGLKRGTENFVHLNEEKTIDLAEAKEAFQRLIETVVLDLTLRLV